MKKLNAFLSFSGDRLAESGALQLTLANLSIDHYPYINMDHRKHIG